MPVTLTKMTYLYIVLAIVCMWQPTINCVPCNCGLGRGVNVCTSNPEHESRYPMVVRPQNLPPVDISALAEPGRVTYQPIVTGANNIAPLKPVGDLCSCGKAIIKPAHIPRPACASCAAAANIESSTLLNQGSSTLLNQGSSTLLTQGSSASSFENSQSGVATSSNIQSSQIQQVGGLLIDYPVCGLPVLPTPKVVQYGSQVPADAVSRAIVLNELQKKRHSVDHLQFGTRTQPREAIKTFHTNKHVFPEENCLAHNGETLILGDLYQDSPAEEEISEEEEELEPEPQRVVIQPVTFGSLGFVPTNVAPTRFVNVAIPESTPDIVQTSSCGVDAAPYCNDGYVSGQVILNEDPIRQQVVLPQSSVSYHGDEGNPRYFSGPQYTYSDSSVSSNSRSSSSSSSTNSENTYVRRFGCAQTEY